MAITPEQVAYDVWVEYDPGHGQPVEGGVLTGEHNQHGAFVRYHHDDVVKMTSLRDLTIVPTPTRRVPGREGEQYRCHGCDLQIVYPGDTCRGCGTVAD